MAGILALIAVLAGLWFWHDSMAAREAANAAAQGVCQREGLQFLDGTVAFATLRLGRHRKPLVLLRIFSFEFSVDGLTRHGGYVTMDGRRVHAVDLPPGILH